MGLHWFAYAAIGLKVHKNKVTTIKETKKRGCECDIKILDSMKYCTKCGSKIWYTSSDISCAFDLEGYQPKFKGFRVLGTSDESDNYFIICGAPPLEVDVDKNIEFLDIKKLDINSIKKKMQTKLVPTGLWDETKFGLHMTFAVD